MIIRNQKEFAAGAMYVGIGIVCAVGGTFYSIGTARAMGPGYMPILLGLLLAFIGVVVALQSFRASEEEKLERWDIRTIALILGSVIAFSLLIDTMGLIVSVFVTVFISGLAEEGFTLRRAFLSSVVLAAVCALIFVAALGLQLRLLPALS